MKKQAIIVLSSGITKKGKLPFFVKKRLDKAFKYFHMGISSRIIVCGKWNYLYTGEPVTKEACAMADYLISLGVTEKNIYLEEKSQDLLSSAYYLKKDILLPKNLLNILIISSDFCRERVEYVFNKVLGLQFSTSFHFAFSNLTPEVLWGFFIYEKHAYLSTKAFLRQMKRGDHQFLEHKFFSAHFYKSRRVGYIRSLVAEGRIGKQTKIKLHYSLKNIYKKRMEIFKKFELEESKFARGLQVDFWSDRFLNFVGKDKNKRYYSLKFTLQPRDKKAFEKEILLTRLLQKKGLTFVPTVIAEDLKQAPIWYLNKVMSGQIAGKFSIFYSFDDHFYKDFTIAQFIQNLSQLRQIKLNNKLQITKWNGALYKRYLVKQVDTVRKYKDFTGVGILQQIQDLFNKKAYLLDKTPLYLSHNDLHPGNIIVSHSQKKIYFVDFEHAGLNNIALDFCFGYVFSWNNSVFQNKLYRSYIKSLSPNEKNEFMKTFPLVYYFILVWFLRYVIFWKDRAGIARYKEAKRYVFSQLQSLQAGKL